MQPNISDKPGLYLHIPFCEKKCGYCDFYSLTNLDFRSSFLESLNNEIELAASDLKNKAEFDTIYFGGGTPSLLTAGQIESILDALHSSFQIAEDVEITLETNPGTITKNTFSDFWNAGVNRLSIGVQSFNDKELKFLERIHDAEQAEKTILAARAAGFENYSIDLIFALPGQSLTSWQQTLEKAFTLEPKHISAYNLIFEEGTPFYQRLQNNEISPLPDEHEIRFWEFTLDTLMANNFLPYEVSNFAASEKFYSRHNIKYWQHTPYLGFGPSAHSFWDCNRWSNVRSLELYMTELKNNKKPIENSETLDDITLEFEHIFLHLRTYEGLNLNRFQQIFHTSFPEKYKKRCDDLLGQELAEQQGGYFKLTRKGMIICDSILPEFYRA